jgi:hypothetical protein
VHRTYRAGQSIEDHCRQCHDDRGHTIVVVDAEARPLRVRCDYCGSEHNFRGGPRQGSVGSAVPAGARARPIPGASTMAVDPDRVRLSEPLVDERERRYGEVPATASGDLPPSGDDMSAMDFELLLRRVIREETGLTPVAPAEKWRGGDLVLRPGKPGLQEKSWPIETFFKKVVMLRNRLRTLEQQVNASDLPEDQKVKLQGYITGCYGSLTSFNVLFAEDEDRFVGAADGAAD